MHIHKLRLINFKRFSDLTLNLSALPSNPKLVLLIGANGSGKTCVFDALEWLSNHQRELAHSHDDHIDYYKKKSASPFQLDIEFSDGKKIHCSDTEFTPSTDLSEFTPTLFYGRSSLRQVTRLTRTAQGSAVDPLKNSDRPHYYIDRDERFENDIDMITVRILEEVFAGETFGAQQLKEKYIAPINAALTRIFGDDVNTSLTLQTLIPPRNGRVADIRFRKGRSEVHYDLLSSGEKEVFNILLNLFNRRDIYQDTIYFIDELDLHLNTALQYALLEELVENWIPEHCQLWTASHSLGFIQYAQASADAAILNFDQFDFDRSWTLTPQQHITKQSHPVPL